MSALRAPRSSGKVRAARLTDLAALGELSRLCQSRRRRHALARPAGQRPADRRVQPVPAAARRVPPERPDVRVRGGAAGSPASSASSARRSATSGRSSSSMPSGWPTPATSATGSSSSSCARAPSAARPASTSPAPTPTATSSCSCRPASCATARSTSCSGAADRELPEPWPDERAAGCRIRPTTPLDALPLRPAVRAGDARARSPASRRSGCADWERQGTHWRVPRSSLTPILRFADVEGFVQASPDGGKDGTQLDGFLQIGVAKEDQPHYLKVIARPGGRHGRPHRLRAGRHRRADGEGRRPSPRPRGHRPGPNLRITDRPAPGGGRLRFDRQRQPADEGNPRPCRRAGPRAGRRPLMEARVGIRRAPS